MKLSKSQNANINYLAKIVNINTFRSHSDPEINKLKCAVIDGFNIICGIDEQPGLFVYFPTGCCLNPDFLRYANLYRHKELNNNPDKTGMFEDNGRVKAIRLRGELSEGFIIPTVVLENYILSVTNIEFKCTFETEFDCVEHNGKQFWINKKYVIKSESNRNHTKSNGKQPKGLNRLIENQFRFHYNTILVKKVPKAIHPDDIIQVSSKWHGISHISARVLCKQPLNWKQKIAKWLTGEEFNKYDYLYSSRTVIKNKYYNPKVSSGFFGVDVWRHTDDIIKPCLQKGMSVYAEIVGYCPDGKVIQKGYDYGCVPPKKGETYTHGTHFKIAVYRITLTNVDGIVHEFSAKEVQQWCANVGLPPVIEYYYGYAKDLYPDLPVNFAWNDNFLYRLANDERFYMEKRSPECVNNVPHEGIVVRIENMKSEAFKLKCFKFINKSQDDPEMDKEDE